MIGRGAANTDCILLSNNWIIGWMWIRGLELLRRDGFMNQCLRCNKQCSVASLFCDKCRVLVEHQVNTSVPPAQMETDISILSTSPHAAQAAIPSPQHNGAA